MSVLPFRFRWRVPTHVQLRHMLSRSSSHSGLYNSLADSLINISRSDSVTSFSCGSCWLNWFLLLGLTLVAVGCGVRSLAWTCTSDSWLYSVITCWLLRLISFCDFASSRRTWSIASSTRPFLCSDTCRGLLLQNLTKWTIC